MKSLILSVCALLLPTIAAAEQRYALLIGNEDYTDGLSRLENPIEDVERVADALIDSGFPRENVTVLTDASEDEIVSAFRTLERQLQTAGETSTGFIYYSGHGATYDDGFERGAYMIPTREGIQYAEDLLTKGVSIEDRIERLSKTGAGSIIFVVDACRNTLTFRDTKSAGGVKGIGSVSAPPGLLVAFAADDGYFADDDSVFSTILAEEIRRPGQRADQAFLNVANRVAIRKQDKTKSPVIQPRLTREFCFVSCVADEEDSRWAMAKLFNSANSYGVYIAAHPNGKYIDEARERLANLPAPSSAPVAAKGPEPLTLTKAWSFVDGDAFNDLAFAVTALPDDAFAVAGNIGTGSDGSNDALVVALDRSGRELWRQRFDGTKHDNLRGMTRVTGGGMAVAGSKWMGSDRNDVWVARLDDQGAVLWEKVFGGPSDDFIYGIAPLSGGELVVAGWTSSKGAGGRDILVARLNSRGDVLWERTFGGTADEEARAVAALDDGSMRVVGWSRSNSSGKSAMLVLALDANGENLWERSVGGDDDDVINAVAALPDGGLVLAGSSKSLGAKGGDVWVLALDRNGRTRWERTIGGERAETANGITVLDDGSVVVAGVTASKGSGGYDMWVVGLSADGDYVWESVVGDRQNDVAQAVAELTDGSFAVVGSTAVGSRNNQFNAVRLQREN